MYNGTHATCACSQETLVFVGKMVRPGGFELPTSWFVAVRSTLPNLARGVANRTNSASWCKFPQPAFSFICCQLPHFCRRFPQLALHFRDSCLRGHRIRCPRSILTYLWCTLPFCRHKMQSPQELLAKLDHFRFADLPISDFLGDCRCGGDFTRGGPQDHSQDHRHRWRVGTQQTQQTGNASH